MEPKDLLLIERLLARRAIERGQVQLDALDVLVQQIPDIARVFRALRPEHTLRLLGHGAEMLTATAAQVFVLWAFRPTEMRSAVHAVHAYVPALDRWIAVGEEGVVVGPHATPEVLYRPIPGDRKGYRRWNLLNAEVALAHARLLANGRCEAPAQEVERVGRCLRLRGVGGRRRPVPYRPSHDPGLVRLLDDFRGEGGLGLLADVSSLTHARAEALTPRQALTLLMLDAQAEPEAAGDGGCLAVRLRLPAGDAVALVDREGRAWLRPRPGRAWSLAGAALAALAGLLYRAYEPAQLTLPLDWAAAAIAVVLLCRRR